MKIQDRLAKAKFVIHQKFPFYSPLAFSLTTIIDNSLPSFMATDGVSKLFVNEKSISEEINSDNDFLFIFLHELKHIIFMNHYLKSELNLNQIVWNIATDIIINTLTREEIEPSLDLWSSILTPEKFGLRSEEVKSMTSLQIYHILENRFKQKMNEFENLMNKINDIIEKRCNCSGNANTSGNGEKGEDKGEDDISKKVNDVLKEVENDIKKISEENKVIEEGIKKAIEETIKQKELMKKDKEEREKIAKEIERKVIEGQIIAKDRGVSLGAMEKLIEHLFKRVRDWKKVLREEIVSEIKGDWTYAKISDILQSLHLAGYKQIGNLPTMDNTFAVPKLKIAVDTSGSISDKEYKEFLDEIYSIVKSVNVNEADVVMFEADVVKAIKLNGNSDTNKMLMELRKRVGYGGTILSKAIQFFAKKPFDLNRSILIVLTDGEFGELDEEDIKVLRRFKRVIFVITKGGTTRYIPKLSNVRVLEVAGVM
jgi:predicted metal-dependent peptidase